MMGTVPYGTLQGLFVRNPALRWREQMRECSNMADT
jgi:hypothetical protein